MGPCLLAEQISMAARLQVRREKQELADRIQEASRAQRRRHIEKKRGGKARQTMLWHKLSMETEAQKHISYERTQDEKRAHAKSMRKRSTMDLK